MKMRRHGQAAAIGCCRLCLVNQPPTNRRQRRPNGSLRGLDWFVFCVADVQTGFGPFVAVYLTTEKWTQVDIGLVLSVAGLVALVGQVPGGTLVDIARSERLVAGLAIGAISASALIYAAWPIFPAVLAAAVTPCGGELRARAGDGRDQPWPRRTRCDRRAVRPQRPLCLDRQWPGGRRDGGLRLLFLGTRGVHRHRHPSRASAPRASA